MRGLEPLEVDGALRLLKLQTFFRGYVSYPPVLADRLEELTRARAGVGMGPLMNPEADEAELSRITRALGRCRSATNGDVVLGVQLDEVVGLGAFGTVWRGRHLSTGQTRAVKLIHANSLGLKLAVHHFRRGTRVMKHLNQYTDRPSSIIGLFDVDASGLAFSMEFIDGGDLLHIKKHHWDLQQKLDAFRDICKATAFAHSHGVIHRDIKPANIVVSGPGRPILTDFDIADIQFVNTLSAQALGTEAFAAPEQLTRSSKANPRFDIYSLGRLLYYLVVERVPAIDYATFDRELERIPAGLRSIVQNCTAFEPDRRYREISDILSDLDKYAADPDGIQVIAEPRSLDVDLQIDRMLRDARYLHGEGKTDAAIRAAELALEAAVGAENVEQFGEIKQTLERWRAETGDFDALTRQGMRYLMRWGWIAGLALFAMAMVAGWVFKAGVEESAKSYVSQTTKLDVPREPKVAPAEPVVPKPTPDEGGDGVKADSGVVPTHAPTSIDSLPADLSTVTLRTLRHRCEVEHEGPACTEAARRLADQREYAVALSYRTLACEYDQNEQACRIVAGVYENGRLGIATDRSKALRYLERACEIGHPMSCLEAARLLYSGLGVGQDRPRALELYRHACEADDGAGCYYVGYMYRHGKAGVLQDLVTAYRFYGRACRLGYSKACDDIPHPP